LSTGILRQKNGFSSFIVVDYCLRYIAHGFLPRKLVKKRKEMVLFVSDFILHHPVLAGSLFDSILVSNISGLLKKIVVVSCSWAPPTAPTSPSL